MDVVDEVSDGVLIRSGLPNREIEGDALISEGTGEEAPPTDILFRERPPEGEAVFKSEGGEEAELRVEGEVERLWGRREE